MKKQLMIALLSIAPALGVVAQDKLYKRYLISSELEKESLR